jgi:hypothetical protein
MAGPGQRARRKAAILWRDHAEDAMKPWWPVAVAALLAVGGCGGGEKLDSLQQVDPPPLRMWQTADAPCPELDGFGAGIQQTGLDRPGGLLSLPCSYGTTLLVTTKIERDPAQVERFARIFAAERADAEAAGSNKVVLPGYDGTAVVNYAEGAALVSVTTRSANAYLSFALNDTALTSEAAINTRAGDLAGILNDLVANLRE